ncbi:MAG: ABC-F family ATP-binding cassette domain-containing protein [Fibrobacterota bacterium]
MITLQNVSKGFGGQAIFDQIGFYVNPRERIGVVGRNGHGKSTLFNMITGQESCDSGSVMLPKNYRIGFLTQHIRFTQPNILDEACQGLPPERQDESWKVKKILAGLGFAESDYSRPPSVFSGGYQIRLNLAKVLVSEPNLLLLDEPTNFLDIVSIRWLIRFLNNWQDELMIISHDRSFMDSVVTHILGIHRQKVKKIEGSTQDYYGQIEQEEEIHEKRRLNSEKKQKQMEKFIDQFRAKARQANLVQSRIKALDRMEKLSKLGHIETLDFSFNSAPFEAKCMLEARNLTFSYTGEAPWLVENFSLDMGPRNRICIVGKNGKGKTTLLKLLAGKLAPLSGSVRLQPQTRTAYFEQANTAELRDDFTVEQEMIDANPAGDRKRARDVCGIMMFSGDNALKKVRVLSGGEKCRVLLGRLLLTPSNLLLLDEPTHHMDMQSTDALTEAIDAFEGAAVIVTHNERILHAIATQLVVFHRDRLFVYHGGYQQFLEEVGWDEEDTGGPSTRRSPKDADADSRTPAARKDQRRLRAEFNKRRAGTLAPLKKRMEELEYRIMESEKEHEEDTQEFLDASTHMNLELINKLSVSMPRLKHGIDKMYEELDKITREYETHKAAFDSEGVVFAE